MNIKTWLIVAAVFLGMAATIKYFYDGKQELTAANKRLEANVDSLKVQMADAARESALKLEAMEAREKSLIKDRKELENEYNKLLELKKSDACYFSWHDVPLPDSVALLLQ